jgi:NADPH:quinone reductase-like Zn-dependent oxidoreductase
MTGLLSGEWLVRDFEPVASIPSGTKLTAFGSNDLAGRSGADTLRRIVSDVEAGRYRPVVDRVFDLAEAAAAHRYMEENRATGKVVLRC